MQVMTEPFPRQAVHEDDVTAPQRVSPNPHNGAPQMISAMLEEETYDGFPSMQDELNEILEAWFELVSDEEIRAHQQIVEDIRGAQVAERALSEPSMAPRFCLTDQDGDTVDSEQLLQKQPLIVMFYRGKWCPHCNATLMRYSKRLVPRLRGPNGQARAKLVAVSPMQPDGTLFLASKRDLQFSVCSDTDEVARQLGITFQVQPHSQPFMRRWGEDLPVQNLPSYAAWEIPLPAAYLIGTDGTIFWSFLDNDPGVRPDPQAVLDALERYEDGHARTESAPSLTSSLDPEEDWNHHDNGEADGSQHQTRSRDGTKNHSKRRLCNRKCGFVSRMSLFRNGKRNTNTNNNKTARSSTRTEQTANELSSSDSLDLSSSLVLNESPSATSRRSLRGSHQPPLEFLKRYVLPPSSSSSSSSGSR